MPSVAPSPSLIFDDADPGLTARAHGGGTLLSVERSVPAARFTCRLGKPRGVTRAVALFRYEPFWMMPRPIADVGAVPPDTQLLLLELGSGAVALVVPLLAPPYRVGLAGADGALVAVADSGDPETSGKRADLVYVAVGSDLHALVANGADDVARLLGVRLRRAEHPPDFVDRFGWCTWDAFYRDVSHERVREGLESFRKGGVEPRFLILDDGWQPVRKAPTGEERLGGVGANEKFPGGLGPTVRLAKESFSVTTFLVWHAVHGYWGGLDEQAFPDLGVSSTLRWQSPEILAHFPQGNWEFWGAMVGRPAPSAVPGFYDRYHAALAAEGVDGVKVDNQASIEGLAHGAGGRVEAAREVRAGLEASVARHFRGRLINCMSCSTDLLYQTKHFGLTRTSTDFWPNRPESHGLHAYTNALVSLWFGEFADVDFDMFQSGHPAGAFHAALRAVSGGPVYVSDKPGSHDFELLKRLVLSDGSVLRARHPGRPTRDCLFENVLDAPVLFKIWNENRSGSGVVGLFNVRHVDGGGLVGGHVCPSDVPTLSGDDFAVYLYGARTVARVRRQQRVAVSLGPLRAEVATIVPVTEGFAALGLADKLNSGGAVTAVRHQPQGVEIDLCDGGSFVAYAARRPRAVRVDERNVPFEHEGTLLTVAVPVGQPRSIAVEP